MYLAAGLGVVGAVGTMPAYVQLAGQYLKQPAETERLDLGHASRTGRVQFWLTPSLTAPCSRQRKGAH